MINSLFISDGPLDRPLLHSQGLPLIRRLSERGVKCFIQSFETSPPRKDSYLGNDLGDRGISWKPIVSNNSNNRFDMIGRGFFEAVRLCKHEGINIVHARSYRPGMIGMLLKNILGIPFLFDMRGFLIDEQVQLGRWNKSSIKYSIGKIFERSLISSSNVLVTTSPQFREMVISLSNLSTKDAYKIVSIPNCTDTSRFFYDNELRSELRRKFDLENKLVLVFTGEVRIWEDFTNVISLYRVIKKHDENAFLLLLLYGDVQAIMNIFIEANLSNKDFLIISVSPSDVPRYLLSSDIGVIIRKNSNFTQKIASPIKFAEYLGCGLPVVINPGIGDTERIIEEYDIGIVLDPEDPEQLTNGVSKLLSKIRDDPKLHERCRTAAEKELSLDSAVDQYFSIYQKLASQKRRN